MNWKRNPGKAERGRKEAIAQEILKKHRAPLKKQKESRKKLETKKRFMRKKNEGRKTL